MNQLRLPISITVIAWLCSISNSCSQTNRPTEPNETVFIATTPYQDEVRELLHISASEKYEMMKWKINFVRHASTNQPATFVIECKYGMTRQGTRGFSDGAQEIILKGKWTVIRTVARNVIFKLVADNSPISLSFIQIGPNLLHLVDGKDQLLVGNGAWSFTFNRADPINEAADHPLSVTRGNHSLVTDSTVEVFDGRMPCNLALAGLHKLAISGCQVTKCRLILFKDAATNKPSRFQFYTIYVGKGDSRYVVEGTWKILPAGNKEPNSIIYQLKPASGDTVSLSFFKADDNVLFLLNQGGTFLVGNEYSSYTLNRNRSK